MMAELLLVGLLGAFFIAFGRSGSPDRIPLRDLTARQFGVALLDGLATFYQLHEQRREARLTSDRARGRWVATDPDLPRGAANGSAREAARSAARPCTPRR
jgi:hypothetical protein